MSGREDASKRWIKLRSDLNRRLECPTPKPPKRKHAEHDKHRRGCPTYETRFVDNCSVEHDKRHQGVDNPIEPIRSRFVTSPIAAPPDGVKSPEYREAVGDEYPRADSADSFHMFVSGGVGPV